MVLLWLNRMCFSCMAYLMSRSRFSFGAMGKKFDTWDWDDSSLTKFRLGGKYSPNPRKTKHDWMMVEGDVELGGKLDVSLVNNFKLKKRQSYEIINVKGERRGEFHGLKEGALVGKFQGKKGRKEKLYITYEAGNGNDVALYTKGGLRKRITAAEKGADIKGTEGADWIDAGNGKNKLWGKGGADVFNIANIGKSHVRIMDYVDGVDRIEFSGSPSTEITTKGRNAHIRKGGDLEAIVMGVTADQLSIEGIYIS